MSVGFAEDFLQRIVNVEWGGGQWFGYRLFSPVALGAFPFAWRIDFPSKAGGTPGFRPIDGPTVDSRAHTPMPYTITTGDLSKELKTSAGAALKGFMVVDYRFGVTFDGLFKLNSFFGTSPFPVRAALTFSGAHTGVGIQMYTIRKNALKKGLVIRDTFDPSRTNLPTSSTAEAGSFSNSVFNFMVDPGELTVQRV